MSFPFPFLRRLRRLLVVILIVILLLLVQILSTLVIILDQLNRTSSGKPSLGIYIQHSSIILPIHRGLLPEQPVPLPPRHQNHIIRLQLNPWLIRKRRLTPDPPTLRPNGTPTASRPPNDRVSLGAHPLLVLLRQLFQRQRELVALLVHLPPQAIADSGAGEERRKDLFDVPPDSQVVWENKSLSGAFASVLGLLQDPVLDSRTVPTDGQPLEDQQHAHGNHDANGQAQAQNAQHEGDLRELDGGQLVLTVVQIVVAVKSTDQ